MYERENEWRDRGGKGDAIGKRIYTLREKKEKKSQFSSVFHLKGISGHHVIVFVHVLSEKGRDKIDRQAGN